MAEKFVKAVAKPSRPDMNPIRYSFKFNRSECCFVIYLLTGSVDSMRSRKLTLT